MPEDVMPQEVQQPGGSDPTQQVAPPPAPVQQQQAPQEPKVMMIPHSAMKREKDEAFAKGRQAGLDQLAKDAGYENHADLVSALSQLRQKPPAPVAPRQAAPQPVPPEETPEDLAANQAGQVATRGQQRAEMALQRNLEKALNERNRYAQSASEYRKELDSARQEVDAIRAEMHLRTIAAGVGVQDVDYSIMLLTREVEKLTPEQAAQFDERAFFDGLRKTKPLLFGETVQPANTGIGQGGAPKPPQPGQVTSQQSQGGRVDARKMDPKQYADLLRARGINGHV